MSIFKSKWIILKKLSRREKDVIYDIFTYDFWRIKCQKKQKVREKNLDIGYILNFEIETRESRDIHKIKNVKIKSEFSYEGKDFQLINEYLRFLESIISNIPPSVPVMEIFDIVEQVNEKKDISVFKIQLARLKIIAIWWLLNTSHTNKTVEKILVYIEKNRIKDILKIKCDDEEIIELLKIL